MDWESLKHFLALARDSAAVSAARTLSVNHSTVLRRIAALESEVGVKLFDRYPHGFSLTDAGMDMFATVAPFEEKLVALQQRLSDNDSKVSGVVRVAGVGSLAPWIFDAYKELKPVFPNLRLEIMVLHSLLDEARLESDIALRLCKKPPEHLVGMRIGKVAYSVYAERSHPVFQDNEEPVLASLEWVTYDDFNNKGMQTEWMKKNIPPEKLSVRINNSDLVSSAVQSGLGLVSPMPCYVGDVDPNLRRVIPHFFIGLDLWLLTHESIRNAPRIRSTMDFFIKYLKEKRELVEGISSQST